MGHLFLKTPTHNTLVFVTIGNVRCHDEKREWSLPLSGSWDGCGYVLSYSFLVCCWLEEGIFCPWDSLSNSLFSFSQKELISRNLRAIWNLILISRNLRKNRTLIQCLDRERKVSMILFIFSCGETWGNNFFIKLLVGFTGDLNSELDAKSVAMEKESINKGEYCLLFFRSCISVANYFLMTLFFRRGT